MFEMANANPAETFEFFMDKEECRVAEDNLRSTLFSSETVDLPMEWKTEPGDFSVDELLGSYFTESDLGSCAEVSTLSSVPEPPLKGDKRGLSLKDEEDFEPFRDLVSLPFDAVMDSLDPSLEAASDSGLSTENLADFMLSPSEATSPEPRGDISVDTLDAISDVSSTSDLGSLTSAGSSPKGRSGTATTHAFPTTRLDENSTTGATIHQHLVDDIDISDLTPDSLPSYNTVLSSTNYPRTMVVTPTQAFAKLNSSTPAPSATVSTTAASAIQQQPASVATRSIKLDLGATTIVGKAVTCITNNNTTTTNSNASRAPFLAKVSAPPGSDTPKISVAPAGSRTTSPQTIVVTQGRKANPILKNSTLLKTGNGRSILLPVNVSDLNQVRTIKIISGGANNGVNKCISSAGVRTLVSTVRPAGPSSTTSTTGTRATFYTTSKGSDGLSLLKVTPTALVSPTTHNLNTNRLGGMPAYIKEEEPSDDEMPSANQDLVFTDEERKLMKKEGLVLPSRYPLTKQEERDLKRIRRKIRNKISAQDSRKRKKEYVDGLEDRVKNCTEENQQLHKKIKTLEKQNESLLVQLKRFQNMVGGGIYYNKPHNHTSTALMMLILSAALFVVPSLRSQDSKGENELTGNNKMPSAGHSRSLLEARNSLNLKTMEGGFLSNDEEELTSNSFSPHALSDHDYAPAAKQARLESSASLISPPNVDKTLSREDGDPPDSTGGGLEAVAALIGAMLDRLSGNWTDPGGSFKFNGGGALNRTPSHVFPDRASVVVSLNHGKRLRDDIELE